MKFDPKIHDLTDEFRRVTRGERYLWEGSVRVCDSEKTFDEYHIVTDREPCPTCGSGTLFAAMLGMRANPMQEWVGGGNHVYPCRYNAMGHLFQQKNSDGRWRDMVIAECDIDATGWRPVAPVPVPTPTIESVQDILSLACAEITKLAARVAGLELAVRPVAMGAIEQIKYDRDRAMATLKGGAE